MIYHPEHGSNITVLRAKLQNDWTTAKLVMGKRDLRDISSRCVSDGYYTWWCHQMETFYALLAICAGNSLHKGQWRGALMFSLICARINRWVNIREAGDSRRYRAHYNVIVMILHKAAATSEVHAIL